MLPNILSKKTGLDPFEKTFNSMVNEFFNDENIFNFSLKNSNVGYTNIKDLEDKYILELQVPGFTKDDIEINLNDNNTLTINGNIEKENEENDNFYRREFKKSTFSRSFILPDNVNIDDIEAKTENGILNISLNKKEEIKKESKRIEIK
jgi:HSP20 family protein